MVSACPMQANNGTGEEKFLYAGSGPIKGKRQAKEDMDEKGNGRSKEVQPIQ